MDRPAESAFISPPSPLRVRRRWTAAPLGLLLALAAACTAPPAPASGDPLVASVLPIGAKLAGDSIGELDKLAAAVVIAADAAAGAPGVDQVLAGAGRVAAQDIATARAAYEKLNLGLIAYLAARAPAQDGLILAHCPMTFGGKGGYWVQAKGELMNPYEGAMMLHCGDVIPWSEAAAIAAGSHAPSGDAAGHPGAAAGHD